MPRIYDVVCIVEPGFILVGFQAKEDARGQHPLPLDPGIRDPQKIPFDKADGGYHRFRIHRAGDDAKVEDSNRIGSGLVYHVPPYQGELSVRVTVAK
jgi:hypothetical protein